MDSTKRRKELLELLQMDIKPISADSIAEKFGVSRQVIVGDIALLRASGTGITATHRGYVMDKRDSENENADTYILACRHDKGLLGTELYTVVDNGGIFVNVSVDHPLYGSLTQPLDIRSRYDAEAFLNKVAVTGAALLGSLTDGAHLHTVRCASPDAYRRILAGLREAGILYMK